MKKIEKYFFKVSEVRVVDGRLNGTVTMPKSANPIFSGASPTDAGRLCVWAEVANVKNEAVETTRLLILQAGDEIPLGWEYMTHIVAAPILFVYRADMRLSIIAR